MRSGTVLCKEDSVLGWLFTGSFGSDILRNPREITALSGRKLSLNCDVDEIQFSAHADFAQTSALIDTLQPRTVVLVHGEAGEMRRLHQALAKKARGREGHAVFMPPNQSTVKRTFRQDPAAKAIGLMAEEHLRDGAPVSGVLVRRAFALTLVHESELDRFAPVARQRIAQRMHVPFRAPWSVLRHYLYAVFDDVVDVIPSDDAAAAAEAVLVGGLVTVRRVGSDRVVLVWDMGAAADMIADVIISVTTQAEFSPLALRSTLVACCPPSATPVPEAEARTLRAAACRDPSCLPVQATPPISAATSALDEMMTSGSSEAALTTPLSSTSTAAAAAASTMSDPLLGTDAAVGATIASPVEEWLERQRASRHRDARELLLAILREWFGEDAVDVHGDDDSATVTSSTGQQSVKVSLGDRFAVTALPKGSDQEAEQDTEASTQLRESVRLAIAQAREAAERVL